MPRITDWDSHIGRRITLRDLHVFFAVVDCGSMAKAASALRVSQPAVSQIIGDLEHGLGVSLLDRSPHGVTPANYGSALLKSGRAAFQDLKQGIQEIEFLADPTAGELRIGCNNALTGSVLAAVIATFSRQYPKVVFHVSETPTPTAEYPELREHKLDFMIIRLSTPHAEDDFYYDLSVKSVVDDRILIVAGKQSPWARRRKVQLADLVNEPWVTTPHDTFGHAVLARAFASCGLPMPAVIVPTFSYHLQLSLAAAGRFISLLPLSGMRAHAQSYGLKILPIDLPQHRWPIAIVTVKNRTLSPLAQRFIDCFSDYAKTLGRTTPAASVVREIHHVRNG